MEEAKVLLREAVLTYVLKVKVGHEEEKLGF
jgi:hypothetical protein